MPKTWLHPLLFSASLVYTTLAEHGWTWLDLQRWAPPQRAHGCLGVSPNFDLHPLCMAELNIWRENPVTSLPVRLQAKKTGQGACFRRKKLNKPPTFFPCEPCFQACVSPTCRFLEELRTSWNSTKPSLRDVAETIWYHPVKPLVFHIAGRRCLLLHARRRISQGHLEGLAGLACLKHPQLVMKSSDAFGGRRLICHCLGEVPCKSVDL